MNFALVQNMLRRPRALRGGKAPLYWKREYSRLTEGLGSLPRTCDWLKEIAETQPRLLSEPLFGTCLTAVTSTGVARSETHDESPDNRLTSPHLAGNQSKGTAFDPTVSSKRRQIQSPSFRNEVSENAERFAVASPLPQRSAPDSLSQPAAPDASHVTGNAGRFAVASQLPRRAPDSLLRRAAPDASRVTENTGRFAVASQLPRRATDSLSERAAPDTLDVTENLLRADVPVSHGRPDSPAVNSSQVTRKEWLQLVAGRVASRWTSDAIFSSPRKYSFPTAGDRTKETHAAVASPTSVASDVPAATPSATVDTIFLSAIQHDWLLPIDGQQASPQLLASLVRRSGTPRSTPERNNRSKETLGGIDSGPASLPSAPDPLASHQRSFADGPALPRPLERLFDKQSPTLPEDIERSRQFEPAINFEEHEQHASPNLAPTVAPTALTPALSPLLPPAFAGAPPLPVAADTARRIAWRDEVEAQETDLSVLAAQVKRILDEEARRHGIDV